MFKTLMHLKKQHAEKQQHIRAPRSNFENLNK